MNTLLKQQLSVIRSSLGAVNSTVADVAYNKNLMKEELNRITKYMNSLKTETNEKISLLHAKIEVEVHNLRVNNAMHTLQNNLDLLIESIIHAQKGSITTNNLPNHPDGNLKKVSLPSQKIHPTYFYEQGLSAPVGQNV